MDFLDDDQSRTLRETLISWTRQNPLTVEPSPETLERDADGLARRLGRDGFMAYAIPHRNIGEEFDVQKKGSKSETSEPLSFLFFGWRAKFCSLPQAAAVFVLAGLFYKDGTDDFPNPARYETDLVLGKNLPHQLPGLL